MLVEINVSDVSQAGDFADWVLDFMGQAVKHFQSLDSLFVTSASNPSTAEVCQRENVVVTSDHGNRSGMFNV